MRRYDGSFPLAETEVVIILEKIKNCIFTTYEIFVTGKILVFHRYLCNNQLLLIACD